MAYATVGAVATAMGRATDSVTDAEGAQWSLWLEAVERRIERSFRRAGSDLHEQVKLGDPTAEEVADVEVAAVVRKVENPRWGVTSSTHSVDDASFTRRNESSSAFGEPLDLLDSELLGLLPGTALSGAYSVRPSFEPDGAPAHWWGQ